MDSPESLSLLDKLFDVKESAANKRPGINVSSSLNVALVGKVRFSTLGNARNALSLRMLIKEDKKDTTKVFTTSGYG